MKISTFNPMLLTPNFEETLEFAKKLGFEVRHTPTMKVPIGAEVRSYRLTDDNGNALDIADDPGALEARLIIRMNVDDFDEAVETLAEMGVPKPDEDQIVVTPSNKSAMIRTPMGFAFVLYQHIKNND